MNELNAWLVWQMIGQVEAQWVYGWDVERRSMCYQVLATLMGVTVDV